MIKIKEDELLHSYLIRVLIIAGELHQPKDLLGMISYSGVIRELPVLPASKRKYFARLTSNDIENILSQNTPYLYKGTKISSFVGDYVFKGWTNTCNKNTLNNRTQLRFCIECFREQIRFHGYTWFRLNWVYSVNCDIHKSRLYYLHTVFQRCCGKSINVFNSLRSAMSGRCFSCLSTNWKFSNTVFLTDWNRSNYLTL